MNFDKRTILAFLLIGVIIILFQSSWYQKTFMPNTYKRTQELKNRQLQKPDTTQVEAAKLDTLPSQPPVLKPVSRPAETSPKELSEFQLTGGVEKDCVIETPIYRAVISSVGARIKSMALKSYLQSDSSYVELIAKEGQGNLAVLFFVENDSINTGAFNFSTQDSGAVLTRENDSLVVSYSVDLGNNQKIEKIYTFYADRYDFDLEVRFVNFTSPLKRSSYFLTWDSGMAYAHHGAHGDGEFAKAYAYVNGTLAPPFDIKAKVGQEQEPLSEGDDNVHWVGQRTKYFASVVIYEKKNAKKVIFDGYKEKFNKANNEEVKVFSVRLEVPYSEQANHVDKFKIFLGPLEDSLLKSYGIGMEEMMSWGWKIIKPFSIAVLWSLKKLHEFIPNYGLVIIIFSILVKILLHPLTHKSYVSMQAMQELQPKMNALKEKYGKDQKRMNEELMKLYKTEGINPLGGCLPMLLQMPILYALFIIFRSTIELRAAHFFWWIKDLSMPDTIFSLGFNLPLYGDKVNVLPIIMGVTMLIQQKMSMKDPKQKAMVYFMPIFMTLLFNSFPSGLNLYYSLFNVFSIIQQRFLTPTKKKEEPEVKKKKL